MTTCDEIETDKSNEQPGLIGLVLFFVMQGVAVILVGFAALFLSFEPVWSAERLSAAFLKPSDARSGVNRRQYEQGFKHNRKVIPVTHQRLHARNAGKNLRHADGQTDCAAGAPGQSFFANRRCQRRQIRIGEAH